MPKRIALIIGHNAYRDKRLVQIGSSGTDLYGLAAALRDPTIGNFSSVEVILNESAGEICRRIDDLFHRKKRHDMLVFYFSGCGLLDQEQLYLAAADTRLDTVGSTAVPASYITRCMDRSFSRQQVIILDCCYSYASGPAAEHPARFRVKTGAVFEGKGTGRVILAAGDTGRSAPNGPRIRLRGENAHFSRYLIQGLRTGAADLDKDGQIDVDELHQYLCRQVAQHPAAQQPCKWAYRELDKFVLARNPAAVPATPIKWDLIFGAIMAPTTTIAIGWQADLSASVGLAGLLLLLYAFLYWVLE